MGLDVSSVGNHEFDEGTTELLRMQNGGCHPEDGCYFPDAPVRRRRLPVARRERRSRRTAASTLLPGTAVKKIGGIKVGFIGMTLEGTPTLVDPAGVANGRVQGRGRDRQRPGRRAQEAGREVDRRAAARGRRQAGTYQQCVGISDPILDHRQDDDPRGRRDHHRPHPPARTCARSPTRPATRAS